MKFKNKNQEDGAKTILEEGKKSEFWKLILQSIAESKEFIQQEQDSEDLKELSPEMYKFTNEVYKAKKQFLDRLAETPDNIISWLQKPSSERQEFDPYKKPSELD